MELRIGAGRCKRVDARLPLLVGLGIADRQPRLEVARRVPLGNAAQRPMVVRATIGLTRSDVLDVAVVMIVDSRDPNSELVGHRARQRALEDGLVIAAIGSGDIAAEAVGGLVRDELDGAASGVAPKQRALRPAQGFGSGKVEDREARGVDRACVTIVLIDRDRGLLLVAIIVLRNAADVEHDLR